jgi:putative transcriptional regulator
VSGTPITNRIRLLRFQQGEMTQQHLADRIGVTRQTVNAIEAGKYSPSLEVAFRIAHVFNAPLETVFQFEAPSQFAPKADSKKPAPSGSSASNHPFPRYRE